ncbi:UNVERIFIED_CONTAM: biotin synthase [Acetivibrio alkalicellulosi]
MDTKKLIETCKQQALEGHRLGKDAIVRLLSVNPQSQEYELIKQVAGLVAATRSKYRSYMWAAIGLDYKPCKMNCNFCSLGEKWGLIHEEYELDEDVVIQLVRNYVETGVRWIVLRTTQFYSFDKLLSLAQNIKLKVKGSYELGVNVGEFDEEIVKRMLQTGIEFVYHSVRIREGIDTCFDLAERKKTMAAIRDSKLKLVSLIEPIGIEHSNEEIADAFLTALEFGPVVTGAMARVPVKGTPLGNIQALSEERLAHIIAVTRLASGYQASDICVHPATERCVEWGANVVVIETGAIPRDSCKKLNINWNDFSPLVASNIFKKFNYQVYSKGE